MKNLYLLLVAFLLLPLCGFSQGENDNWYFGDHAAVNFSSGPANPISGSPMPALEGVASISDASGNLLFYTNGMKIWRSDHSVMPYNPPGGPATTNYNMSYSDLSNDQGVIIIPFPNHPDQYLVFTTHGRFNNDYLSLFSLVDMSSGLGEIKSMHTHLLDQNGNTAWSSGVENITATEIPGGFWVLIAYEDNLLAYKVDGSGVNVNPVTSSIIQISGPVSHIKISPNQDFLTISDYTGDISYIYHFNVMSGMVSSSIPYATFNLFFYAAAFSAQGDIVWFSDYRNEKIYGYNIYNLSIPPKVFTAGSEPGNAVTTLQRGPDGNIYVSVVNSPHLGRISNPNNLTTATYNGQAVYLGGGICHYGLPQLVPPSVCIQDLTLTGYEDYNGYFPIVYMASNSITTKDDYFACGLDVILSAGKYVELLPNTFICADTRYVLVEIGGCMASPASRPAPSVPTNYQTKTIILPTDTQLSTFEVYPNPVIDMLTLALPKEMEIKYTNLYDLMGKQMEISLEGNTVDMSDFAPGVYILKLETNQGTMTKKVIKQ